MTGSFWDVVFLAMAAGVSLICAALIARGCIATCRWPAHAVALMAFFLIMLAETVERVYQSAPQGAQGPQLVGVTLPLIPALGACLWFYVRGLTSLDQGFQRRDLWHLAPVVVLVGCTIPLLLLPQEQRQMVGTQGIDMQDRGQVMAALFLFLGWICWLMILVLYGVASLRRLLHHRRHIRTLLSNMEGVSLGWLHILLGIVFTFTALALVGALLPIGANVAPMAETLAAPFYACLVFTVGLFGVLQKPALPEWSAPAPHDRTPQDRNPQDRTKPKYQRSALQKADMVRIAGKLDAAMRDQNLWRNPDLSLRDVSAATGMTQNNISQTLNDHLGRNFYDYVNGWRIDAACRALRDSDQSVLNISLDVGFNAKSTFNAAFKKLTGQTPRQFRNAAMGHTKGTDGPDRSNPG